MEVLRKTETQRVIMVNPGAFPGANMTFTVKMKTNVFESAPLSQNARRFCGAHLCSYLIYVYTLKNLQDIQQMHKKKKISQKKKVRGKNIKYKRAQ